MTYYYSQLLPDYKKKFKTKLFKDNHNPVWNECFVLDSLKLDHLRNSSVIEVTVWDSPKSSKKEKLIGCLRLGPRPQHEKQLSYMDSSENELTHWMSVINTPGECVEQLHTLRHTLDPLPVTLTSPSGDISGDNVNGNNNTLIMSVSTDELCEATVASQKHEETTQELQETTSQDTTSQETTMEGTQVEDSKIEETIVHEKKTEKMEKTKETPLQEQLSQKVETQQEVTLTQQEVTSTPEADSDIGPDPLLATSEQVPVEMLSHEDDTSDQVDTELVSCFRTLLIHQS